MSESLYESLYKASGIKPLTEGSTLANRKNPSQNTSVRPASLPPSPVRIVRPAPVKSKLTSKQIQAAVKKVSKRRNEGKL